MAVLVYDLAVHWDTCNHLFTCSASAPTDPHREKFQSKFSFIFSSSQILHRVSQESSSISIPPLECFSPTNSTNLNNNPSPSYHLVFTLCQTCPTTNKCFYLQKEKRHFCLFICFYFFFVYEDYFRTFFRFMAKLRGSYGDFPYTPWSHTYIGTFIISIPHQGGTLVTTVESTLTS